jgi:hypothetical protein
MRTAISRAACGRPSARAASAARLRSACAAAPAVHSRTAAATAPGVGAHTPAPASTTHCTLPSSCPGIAPHSTSGHTGRARLADGAGAGLGHDRGRRPIMRPSPFTKPYTCTVTAPRAFAQSRGERRVAPRHHGQIARQLGGIDRSANCSNGPTPSPPPMSRTVGRSTLHPSCAASTRRSTGCAAKSREPGTPCSSMRLAVTPHESACDCARGVGATRERRAIVPRAMPTRQIGHHDHQRDGWKGAPKRRGEERMRGDDHVRRSADSSARKARPQRRPREGLTHEVMRARVRESKATAPEPRRVVHDARIRSDSRSNGHRPLAAYGSAIVHDTSVHEPRRARRATPWRRRGDRRRYRRR